MEQRYDTQNTQQAEAREGDTAQHVVPVHEGIEEPAVVAPLRNGHCPPRQHIEQEDGDECQVDREEIGVDILLIGRMQPGCHGLEGRVQRGNQEETIE